MIRRLLFLLLIILSLNLIADRIDDLIKDVPDVYQNASALNVFTEVSITVEEDFSFKRHVFYVKKMLNYKGKKRYSDVKIRYNADFEEVELGHCFSIDMEGNRIEIPENQIHDMNDTESIMSPEYMNFREKIINFPQIEPGYFVVVDYTTINTRKEPVNGVEHLMETNPYLHKIFSIRFPEKFKLNYFADENIEFSQSKKGDYNIFSWQAMNTNIYKEEKNSPSLLHSGSPVVFSFFKDWRELAKLKLSKISDIKIEDPIKDLAKQITENCKSDNDKVLAVYKYMADNFNEKSSYTAEIDFTPDPLITIIEKKYGSEKELSALFIALLKSAGIKKIFPAVTLINDDRFTDIQKYFAVNDFMDRICVYWNGDIFYPGNSYYPYAATGKNGMNVLVGNKKNELIQYDTEKNLLAKKTYNYSIQGNSASVKITAEYDGADNYQYRRSFLDTPDARRKIWFNQRYGDKSAVLTDGPNFLNFDRIDEKLKLNYTLNYNDLVVDQEPYIYFKIVPPVIKLDVSNDDRENDFQVSDRIFFQEDFTVNLKGLSNFDDRRKDGFKYNLLNDFNSFRESLPIDDQTAYYELNSKIDGDDIIVSRTVYIPETIIPADKYQEFRQFILSMKNPVNNMVFLKRN